MSIQDPKKQAKNIEVLPSQMYIEGYVRVKFRCVCCRRKFAPDGELRKEDVDEILAKNFQPLCRNCAKQSKKHCVKYGELEGKLSAIQKLIEETKRKAIQRIDTLPIGCSDHGLHLGEISLCEKIEALVAKKERTK